MLRFAQIIASALAFERVEVTGINNRVNVGVLLSYDFPEGGTF